MIPDGNLDIHKGVCKRYVDIYEMFIWCREKHQNPFKIKTPRKIGPEEDRLTLKLITKKNQQLMSYVTVKDQMRLGRKKAFCLSWL